MNELAEKPCRIDEIDCLDGLSLFRFARSLHEMIARRAYNRWLARRCPTGTALQNWMEAEAEVEKELDVAGKAGMIRSALTSHHSGASIPSK